MAIELQQSTGEHHSVTAFFDEANLAEKSRADLIRAGYPESDVALVPGAEAAVTGSAAPSAPHQSILKSLLDIFVFMPSEDRLTYAEGLRRGGMALVVRTGPEGYERAIDILDRDGAVDLDERQSSWSGDATQGGAGPRPGSPGSSEQAGFERANRHDPLVNTAANSDVRERIGVGTSDMTVSTDPAPPNAATESGRSETGERGPEIPTARRDVSHGRSRVRSYIAGPSGMPGGIDPQI